jgi:hypothetical protein
MSSFRNKLGDVQTFIDPKDCIPYIQSHSNEQIYLIISGLFARKTVPQIYNSLNLIQIFLLCGSVADYSEWALDYCEKMLIFDHEDDLLARLWGDLEIKLREQAHLCLKQAQELKQKALKYKQSCA